MINKLSNKKKKEEVKEAGTWEDYVMKLISEKKAAFSTADINSKTFHRIGGQIDIMYMILTGWNNPLSNPKSE